MGAHMFPTQKKEAPKLPFLVFREFKQLLSWLLLGYMLGSSLSDLPKQKRLLKSLYPSQ